MAALPGLTMNLLDEGALVSVSSLVLRDSFISVAQEAMVSALSRNCRRLTAEGILCWRHQGRSR